MVRISIYYYLLVLILHRCALLFFPFGYVLNRWWFWAFVCMRYRFYNLRGLFLFKGQLLKSIPWIGFISQMTIDNVFPNCLGWGQMCQAFENHCGQTMTFYVLCIRPKSSKLELRPWIFFLSANILALQLAIVPLNLFWLTAVWLLLDCGFQLIAIRFKSKQWHLLLFWMKE